MKKGIENYGEADAKQQNYENNFTSQKPLSQKQKAKEQLKAELYSIKKRNPDLSIEGYRNKLYQWAWVEEYDEIFDDLELSVEEVLENNLNF